MKVYKQGEKGKAICETCKQVVATTLAYRDVPFSDSPGEVKDILVAVCDTCDSVVAIPPQSTPAIKKARETATKPIEVNLPAPYLEILDLAAYRIDPKATGEFRKRLLAYYIHMYSGLISSAKIPTFISSTTFVGKFPSKRLSFKVTPRLYDEINSIIDATHLSKTDMIKGIVQEIEKDIVRPEKPKHLAELQRLAVVSAA